MKLLSKLNKCKLFLVLSSIVLSVSVASCSFNKNLSFNRRKGEKASMRVENAQYTPDLDKFIQTNQNNSVKLDSVNPSSKAKRVINFEDFMDVINLYATIENYAGAGKYLGYDVYEIKDEIAFVIKHVPAFNQWFRMPYMRAKDGYADIPYYELWAYYLEMNDNVLSITRVCWCTRCSYYDFDKREEVEDHDDGTSFVQYEIMKTNYYIDENKDEVVECYIYSVGIDNVKNGSTCNSNVNDYYPFEYQYLKNVKDKTLVKYHITASTQVDEDRGMDIRGLTPYGARREFMAVDYANYKNIRCLIYDSLENETFESYDEVIQILLDNIGYKTIDKPDYTSKSLIDDISKYIVDNFELKDNWPKIYKENINAVYADTIPGPFYGKKIPVDTVSAYLSCRDRDLKTIEIITSVVIIDNTQFDFDKYYSLSTALRNRKTGELKIIATQYQKLDRDTVLSEYAYIFSNETIYLDASAINVENAGVYDFTTIITYHGIDEDEDFIFFDTLETSLLGQYYGLEIPDSIDTNGNKHSYYAEFIGHKLAIHAS